MSTWLECFFFFNERHVALYFALGAHSAKVVGWTEPEETCARVAAVNTRGDTSRRWMPGLANAGARIWCTGLAGRAAFACASRGRDGAGPSAGNSITSRRKHLAPGRAHLAPPANYGCTSTAAWRVLLCPFCNDLRRLFFIRIFSEAAG